MEHIERIEALLERYFEGRTSSGEECELREFLTSGQQIPARLHYARAMFGGMKALATDGAPAREWKASGSRDRALSHRRVGRWLRMGATGIAAAGVAVGLFALVSYLNRPYCYIDGVAVRDVEVAMQATVYFERLGALDKPMERLDGILEQLKNDK